MYVYMYIYKVYMRYVIYVYIVFFIPCNKLFKLALSSWYYKLGNWGTERLSTLQCVIHQGNLCLGLFNYEIYTINH